MKHVELPTEPLPLLPLRSGVLLPGTLMTVSVGRKRSVALLESLPDHGEGPLLGVGIQRDPRVSDPSIADLHPVATLARVVRVASSGRGTWQVTLQGLRRFSIEALVQEPFWQVEAAPLDDVSADAAETKARADARDVDDVPEAVREALTFTFAEDMADVLDVALLPGDAGLDDRVGSTPDGGPGPGDAVDDRAAVSGWR